ncbi:hypothetical protein BYT27DRAFT_7196596 [Phlegmacium glaucopus]|nr:hypothetical protein BYT27DRAFT_7196596 [Phlegmacium glaucopus]
MPRGGSNKRNQHAQRTASSSETSSVGGKGSLKDIAASTLNIIEHGSYEVDGVSYNLKEKIDLLKASTVYYAADADISEWSSIPQALVGSESKVHITVSECSTLAGARELKECLQSQSPPDSPHDVVKKVGVLCFGSAKNPGGGFIKGAQAQEESIARSSTLYPSLITKPAEKFYRSHRKDPKEGYYSHAMIYSPHVLFIRDDKGEWQPPVEVDVVTSAGVNAGVVRRYLRERKSEDESGIYIAMKERMARILFLFERHGVRNVVLGSFGTGVFRNSVELVAGIWAELLTAEDARFKHSFDHVVFAILGHSTFKTFQNTFAKCTSHL